MIVERTRIGKLLSLPWLRLCSPFVTEKMKFSLSQSAQRAVWSSTITKLICLTKGSNQINDPSLRQKLLNLKHPADFISDPALKNKIVSLKNNRNEQLVFDDWIRDQFLGLLFTEGVALSPAVSKQARIILANEPTIQGPAKFMFCPNLLVTQLMFLKLIKYKTDILIYGGFGIGKTVALILFNLLSSIINKFVYQAFSDKALKQELNFLRAHGLIADIPKQFYWSLNLNDTQLTIKKLIIDQATELSDAEIEELNRIGDYREIITILRNKYGERNITVQTVIDQINILAALLRKLNNSYTNSKNNPQYQKENKDKIKKQQKTALFVKSQIQDFQKLGESTFYNSSMAIEKSLLKRTNEQGKITLEIQKSHEPISQYQVPYLKNLQHKWGCNDYSHFFWFQIQKRLKRQNIITADKLAQLQKIFNEHVSTKKWPAYLRFVNIRRMLEKKQFQLQQVFKNIQEGKNFQESVVLFTELLRLSSIEDFKSNLQAFIKPNDSFKDKQNKIKILSIFFNTASQSESNDDIFEIQVSVLSEQLKTQQIIKYLDSDFVNKQMFQIQFGQKTNKIIFFWSPKEFMENVKGFLFPLAIGNPQIDLNLAKNIAKSAKAHGCLIEGTLIDVLKIQNTVANLKYANTKAGLDDFFQTYFITKARTTFIQFFKNDKSIPKNMRNLLVTAHKNPYSYIFASPVAKSTEAHGQNSPSIDFAYMRYNLQTKVFELFTFDVTITKSKHQIRKSKPLKCENLFKQLIENLKSSLQQKNESQVAIKQFVKNKKITILHTILCTQNVDPIYEVTKVDGRIICEIRTANLYDLTPSNLNPNSLEFVNALRAYLMQINLKIEIIKS